MPISKPPADCPLDRFNGTLLIIDAKRDSLVVAEVAFSEIPLQVLLANVMVDTVDTAFQDREIAFDGIGVNVAAHILTDAVVQSAFVIPA